MFWLLVYSRDCIGVFLARISFRMFWKTLGLTPNLFCNYKRIRLKTSPSIALLRLCSHSSIYYFIKSSSYRLPFVQSSPCWSRETSLAWSSCSNWSSSLGFCPSYKPTSIEWTTMKSSSKQSRILLSGFSDKRLPLPMMNWWIQISNSSFRVRKIRAGRKTSAILWSIFMWRKRQEILIKRVSSRNLPVQKEAI